MNQNWVLLWGGSENIMVSATKTFVVVSVGETVMTVRAVAVLVMVMVIDSHYWTSSQSVLICSKHTVHTNKMWTLFVFNMDP